MTTATLTDFRTNTKKHITRLRRTGEPEVLTLHGKAQSVMLSPEAYDDMARRLDRAETVEMIRVGLKQVAEGKCRPAREFFAEFAQKNGIDLSR